MFFIVGFVFTNTRAVCFHTKNNRRKYRQIRLGSFCNFSFRIQVIFSSQDFSSVGAMYSCKEGRILSLYVNRASVPLGIATANLSARDFLTSSRVLIVNVGLIEPFGFVHRSRSLNQIRNTEGTTPSPS